MGVVVRPVSSWYLRIVYCEGTCRTRVVYLLRHSDGPTHCSTLVLCQVGHSDGPTHCSTLVLCQVGHSDGPTHCSTLVLCLVGHRDGPTHCPALPPVRWVPWNLASWLLVSDHFSTWWSCFSTSPYTVCHVL